MWYELLGQGVAAEDSELFDEFKMNKDNVNHCDQTGENVLMKYLDCASPVSPTTVKAMIESGIDVNRQDNLKKTALIWCAANTTCSVEVYRMLVQAGANVNIKDLCG